MSSFILLFQTILKAPSIELRPRLIEEQELALFHYAYLKKSVGFLSGIFSPDRDDF